MWCGNCQQDVPAVASGGDTASVRCARCGESLRTSHAAPSDAASENASAEQFSSRMHAPPANSLLDWKLDDELREAQRLVRLVQGQADGEHVASDRSASQADSASSSASTTRSGAQGGLLSWTLSGLGLSGLVCGCSLLIWSLVSTRDELWTIGLPTALVSQVILICGVLLRRDDGKTAMSDGPAQSTAVIQMQSSTGGMHPSGLSVHFSNTATGGQVMNSDQLRKEIEAVVRRNRAA